MYFDPTHQTVNNHDQSDLDLVSLDVELCFAFPNDGTVPQWVQLLPAGKTSKGIDGRSWLNDNPQGVIDYFNSLNRAGRGLPFDWEHSTELKAPKGEEAPASAWGQEMQLRDDGSVWARPEWTPRGRDSVASKEYRYLSPAVVVKKSTGQIVGIKSVGLTNIPNFTMTALNRADHSSINKHTTEEAPMSKAILAALGLNESASDEAALAAISSLKGDLTTANNRAENPSIEKFVPAADHNLALNRATTAEQKLKDIETGNLDKEIEVVVSQALKDKKIAPNSVDYHTENCRAEGGLDKFKKHIEATPAIIGGSTLDGKQPSGDEGVELNVAQQEMADIFGNTAEDIKKHAP